MIPSKILEGFDEFKTNYYTNEELTTNLYYIPNKQDLQLEKIARANEKRQYNIKMLLQEKKRQEELKRLSQMLEIDIDEIEIISE